MNLQDCLKRYLVILVGLGGALTSGYLVIDGLVNGCTTGISRAAWITGTVYHQASQGPQFWFSILFWSVFFVLFAWMALSAYRS